MSTSPLPAPRSFVVREPVDLIALAPLVLGFRPAESVVMETFGGPAGSFHARGELLRGHHDQDVLAQSLATAAVRNGAVMAGVVVFSGHLARARRQGRVLCDRLREAGLDVIDVVVADGAQFHDLEGGPPVPYDLAAHPFTAQWVFEGEQVHGSREDLARSLVGTDDHERAAVAEAAAAVIVDGLEPEALRAEGLWIQGRIRNFRRVRTSLTAVEAGRMLALCASCFDLFEVAWAEMTRVHGSAHVELWRDLVRRAPDPLLGPAAALLSFAAWLHGDGALAWCAVERARAGGCSGPLAEEVAVALMEARPPTSWEPFCAGLFTA